MKQKMSIFIFGLLILIFPLLSAAGDDSTLPVATEPPFCSGNAQFTHNPFPDYAIFDNDCPLFTVDPITVTGLEGTISKVMVRLTIYHTYVADLQIFLQHPSGAMVELTTENGGFADMHYIDTIFDDDAAVSIVNGTAPYTGSYRPEGNLSDFAGLGGNGEWHLLMCDDNEEDVGYFDRWDLCLEMQSSPTPTAIPTTTPAPLPVMNNGSMCILIFVLSLLLLMTNAGSLDRRK